MGSEMVIQHPAFVASAIFLALIGVASMVSYSLIMILGIRRYRLALQEMGLCGNRSTSCFVNEKSYPSRSKKVSTLLFIIRSRSSNLPACRRFGRFLFAVVTPFVLSVIALLGAGLLAQGIGLVLGVRHLLWGMVEDRTCRIICVGIGIVYFSLMLWWMFSCSYRLIRMRNVIRRSHSSRGKCPTSKRETKSTR